MSLYLIYTISGLTYIFIMLVVAAWLQVRHSDTWAPIFTFSYDSPPAVIPAIFWPLWLWVMPLKLIYKPFVWFWESKKESELPVAKVVDRG